MLGEKVMTILEVHYPGGLSAYEESGGSIFIVPESEIIFYHPNLESKIKAKVLSALKSIGYKVSFVSVGNFEGFDLEQIKDFQAYLIEKLMSLGLGRCSIVVSKPTVFISLPDIRSTHISVKRLRDFLSIIDGLVRGHIECSDKILHIGKVKSSPKIKRRESSRIQTEYNRPKRDTRINEDDVLNLKIALESSRSFEEFLNNI